MSTAGLLAVRALAPGDADAVVGLREQLFASDPDAHWAAGAEDWRPHYRAQLDDELRGVHADTRTLVATVDDAVVGTLTAIVDRHLAGPAAPTGRSGWIQGVFVAPAARGRGLAGRLTAAAEEWLRGRGARTVALASTPAAESLYRGRGYIEDGETHFRKELR
ncbi:GNAT family N-acetyltransferase [Tsukamurella paurometabola]|uniref:GNAT family N-acetyltransferase n=1 Tax=Tsukamurella paurometabola TaxID=2061 RepID=A0A3P8LDK9_TSUPA|nr:GNAT family N-acetyltransferase [Tsukamurella paurometabola]MBS4099846.1 GNAT family N-acetyltransferase [Tsukamurella paurometabola]UEA81227.1 GNAT family N-acetyltransferase [Tsukamurella paurometabola]VDR38202.1 putative acetyltransferase [Tsukamurella paurometabola]